MNVATLLRGLRSQPLVVAAAILMLSLAVGITTAAFTTLDALVLRPVPFHAPKDLAHVYMGDEHGGTTTVAPEVLRAWRESPALAAAESANSDTVLLDVRGSLVERRIARVTPGLFQLVGGIRPIRGRLFDAHEERVGDRPALLSEDLWRSVCDADAALVGGRIRVNGESFVVVGILPSSVRFPAWDTALWTLADFASAAPGRGNARPRVFVRFSPRMTRSEAVRRLAAAAHEADPGTVPLRPIVEPLVETVVDQLDRRAAPVLAGGVVLVFLVLCANVCSLLLARVGAQRHDYAARAALGASRARLMRHALAESAAIATLAVVGGAGIGWALVALARAFLPDAYMAGTLNPLDIDLRALSVTAASGAAATMLVGLVPGWMATRSHALDSLRAGSRGGTDTRGGRAAMRALLVVEIAMACALLAGATSLVRSFVRMAHADRGLETAGVTTAFISLPASAFPTPAARAAIARTIEERLRQLPGVRLVVWSRNLPPDRGNVHFGEWLSDAPGARPVDMVVESYNVGPDYFAMYDIPILRGRGFAAGDGRGRVIVGERLARTLWPDLDPVGRTFRFERQHFEVVGLARETNLPSLDPRQDLPEFYIPFNEAGSYPMLSIRCGRGCPSTALIRQQIALAHPTVEAVDVRQLDDVYLAQLARPRAAAALGVVFSGVALLAAAGGLFAVLSYAVGRRRRELGIRAALGATPWRVGGLVLRESVLVGCAGILLGSVLGAAGSRAMGAILYGGSGVDLPSEVLVVAVLACTLAAASWRPARSASRSDPARLLREE